MMIQSLLEKCEKVWRSVENCGVLKKNIFHRQKMKHIFFEKCGVFSKSVEKYGEVWRSLEKYGEVWSI